jgi:olfactory receptor-like protein
MAFFCSQPLSSCAGETRSLGTILDDRDWIVEHARQVCLMLPGGVDVLGLYAFAADCELSACDTRLGRVAVDAWRRAARVGPAADQGEALVLRVVRGTRSVQARVVAKVPARIHIPSSTS